MPAVSALRQNAMQDRGARRAIAHGRRELEVDDLRDPTWARGNVTAAQGGADRFGGAANLNDPTQAVERGEPRCRLGLEVGERVVLQNKNVVLFGQSEDAMRCGYIAAREDWIDELVDLKLAATMGNSATNAHILHRVLMESGYRRHLDGLRRKLADAMGRTLENLRRRGLIPWIEPRAGIYLWARLPEDAAAADVARHALARKVVFAPGPAFSASSEARGYLRFNIARCSEPRVYEVLDEAVTAALASAPASATNAAL